jgi:hypothetical protein
MSELAKSNPTTIRCFEMNAINRVRLALVETTVPQIAGTISGAT